MPYSVADIIATSNVLSTVTCPTLGSCEPLVCFFSGGSQVGVTVWRVSVVARPFMPHSLM